MIRILAVCNTFSFCPLETVEPSYVPKIKWSGHRGLYLSLINLETMYGLIDITESVSTNWKTDSEDISIERVQVTGWKPLASFRI